MTTFLGKVLQILHIILDMLLIKLIDSIFKGTECKEIWQWTLKIYLKRKTQEIESTAEDPFSNNKSDVYCPLDGKTEMKLLWVW